MVVHWRQVVDESMNVYRDAVSDVHVDSLFDLNFDPSCYRHFLTLQRCSNDSNLHYQHCRRGLSKILILFTIV